MCQEQLISIFNILNLIFDLLVFKVQLKLFHDNKLYLICYVTHFNSIATKGKKITKKCYYYMHNAYMYVTQIYFECYRDRI